MADWTDQIVTIDGDEYKVIEYVSKVAGVLTDREVAGRLSAAGCKTTPGAIRGIRRRKLGIKKGLGFRPCEAQQLDNEITGDSPALTDLESRLLSVIKGKEVHEREISRKLDRSVDTVHEVVQGLREKHYNIMERRDFVMLDTSGVAVEGPAHEMLADEMYMRLMLISDLHAGSTAQQITALQTFVRRGHERGIKHCFVAGDLFAGRYVYKGQEHDVYASSASGQLYALRMTLPELDGLTYHVIGGNHDFSFIKSAGYNIVKHFCDVRSDCLYYGYDLGDVPLTDRADVRLWHPSGGVPYALSYRLQKGVEQIAYEELSNAVRKQINPRVRIVAAGHLHIDVSMHSGPVHGLQVGCFEGQTNYLKRKQLFPTVGGYILEIWLTDAGLVQRRRAEFVDFGEIENDYRTYTDLTAGLHGVDDARRTETLFEWRADGDKCQ